MLEFTYTEVLRRMENRRQKKIQEEAQARKNKIDHLAETATNQIKLICDYTINSIIALR